MSPRTKQHIDSLAGPARDAMHRDFPDLIKILIDLRIYPEIISGRRSQAEQDRLYAQGRTTPGKIVTWTRQSKHLDGLAVDFGLFDKQSGAYLDASNPKAAAAGYLKIASYLQPRGWRWGASFGDLPHFEWTGKIYEPGDVAVVKPTLTKTPRPIAQPRDPSTAAAQPIAKPLPGRHVAGDERRRAAADRETAARLGRELARDLSPSPTWFGWLTYLAKSLGAIGRSHQKNDGAKKNKKRGNFRKK